MMMLHRPTSLVIAGWSARAAAQSARRGGFGVTAIDVFQDADLVAATDDCCRVSSWRELVAAASDLPSSDWLYTGGVENHPTIVAAISSRHRLLGNDAAVLRRVRDPRVLQRLLADGPAPLPKTRRTVPARDDDRSWLLKRRSSGGGMRVLPYDTSRLLPHGAYLQEFICGTPYGASYLAADGRCRLLGLCRQTHVAIDPTRPFLYGGSIGPIAAGKAATAALIQLGEQLTAAFGLRGLFGVDVVLQLDGTLRTLEVNPRYTASMELLERASGRSFVELHARACLEHELPEALSTSTMLHGKRIVYVDAATPSPVSVPLSTMPSTSLGERNFPPLADIPAAGTQPRRGEPFCTVFAVGESENEVERGLKQAESQLRASMVQYSFASSTLQKSGRR